MLLSVGFTISRPPWKRRLAASPAEEGIPANPKIVLSSGETMLRPSSIATMYQGSAWRTVKRIARGRGEVDCWAPNTGCKIRIAASIAGNLMHVGRNKRPSRYATTKAGPWRAVAAASGAHRPTHISNP